MATFNQVYQAVRNAVQDETSVSDALTGLDLTAAELVAYDVMFRILPKRSGYEEWMRTDQRGLTRNEIFQAIANAAAKRGA